MRKRLFVADAQILVDIIEDSLFNDKNRNHELGSEDLTNYWVHDILSVEGKIALGRMYRHLDNVETYCTLTGDDMVYFKDTLIHMMKDFDLSNLGNPTVYHSITDGLLEFYILRG